MFVIPSHPYPLLLIGKYVVKRLITSRDFNRDAPSPQMHSSSSHSSPILVSNPSEYTASTVSDTGSPEAMTISSHFEQSHKSARVDRSPVCSSTYSHVGFPENTSSRYDSSTSNDSVSLLVELISADIANRASAQLGLDADISEHGVDFILSLGANENLGNINSFYNARKLSNIPSRFLFYQPPQLTILSPFFSPEMAYLCTYRVYMDGSIQVHTENIPLLASIAPEEHPSESHVWRAPILPEYWGKLSGSPGDFLRL